MKNPLLSRSAMSPLTRSSLIACASLCAVSTSAFAASQAWNGATDANFVTATNWSAGTIAPGNVTPGSTNDIATFNSALVGTTRGGATDPVVVDASRTIGGATFDTSAGAYQIGTNAGNQIQLTAITAGTNLTQVTAGATNPQVIAAPVFLRNGSGSNNPKYTFRNEATNASSTLSITGTQTWNGSGSRPTFVTLDGANTGSNIISANIANPSFSQNGPVLTKNGAGTWILSGSNGFSGTSVTTLNAANGIQINAGLLVAGNSNALGSTTNSVNNYINNGGTLELNSSYNGSIALNNALTLQLNSGGTIRSRGTNSTDAKINVSNAATVSSTLSAVNAADVFTVGNAANDLTGGASDSVVHINGAGTVYFPNASNYAGAISIDSGTLRIGSDTALGTLGSVNIESAGKLQLNGGAAGGTPTLTVLTGTGTVENYTASGATLTLNIASANTFAGSLQNGTGGGTLALVKTGAGTLTLSGASTYNGATTVTTGTLNVTGSLSNTAVSVPANAFLSGNGTVAGDVSAASGSHVAPGDGGDANIGTLTTGTLSLDGGSQLDFGLSTPASSDKITVTNPSGLTINGGQININGGSAPFTTIGTYNLIGYSGTIGGAGVGSLSINESNKSATRIYTLAANGSFITLTVADSGIVARYWNTNASSTWGTASNWSPVAIPNAVGAYVGFGGGGTEVSDNRTITVNGSFTVGTLAFNAAVSGKSYTLAAGSGANLTLDNGSNPAFITDTSGNHTIDSPLLLTGYGATVTVSNAAHTLTIGGVIDGNGNPLVKGGAGTLALNGTNIYVSGTTINGGTVLINNPASLGDYVSTTIINAGTLKAAASFTSSNTFQLGDGASTIAVPTGVTYTIDGSIGDSIGVGTLNKTDVGTLVLSGSNSYSGGTVINAGTVQIYGATSLGSTSGVLTLNNAVLQPMATFTGTRNVVLGHANSTVFAEAAGVTYTMSGAVSGSGTLNKTGAGAVSLGSNANTYSGGTMISAGTLNVNNGSSLGSGAVVVQGGATLKNNYPGGGTFYMGNALSVPASQTGTLHMGNRMVLGSAVSGSGTLNVIANTDTARNDLSNNWAGFTGQVNISGTGLMRLINNGGSFNTGSFTNCALDLGVVMEPSNYSGNNTYTIGALSGTAPNAGFKSPAQGGSTTLSVGGRNTSTSFAGQTLVCHLTKVGTGTLSLTGTAPTGNTTVTAGTLSLGVNNLSDTSTVNIGANGTLNLNFTGQDVVTSLIIGPDTKVNGIYGAPGSGAQFEDSHITGPGFLKVGADPFTDWIDDFAVNGKTAKTDDPDGDGLTNLDEFALNSKPDSGVPSGKIRSRIETVGGDQVLVITLPVRTGANFDGTPKIAIIDHIKYTVEGSNDLSLFDQAVTEITVSSEGMPTVDAGWTYRTFRLNGAIGGATPRGPKGFLRAKVEESL